MKKFIALLCTFAMVLSLCACASSTAGETKATETTAPETTQATEAVTEAATEATTEAATEAATEEVVAAAVEETTEAVAEASAEEVVAAAVEETTEAPAEETTEETANPDQEAADEVAALIDAIYVQTRNVNTDEQCAAAKAAWDALTDEQKELVEGEEADPDYFGRDTGDASLDDPRNADEIGEKEILVVSFGTSFNDSRAQDIKGVEDAIQAAFPDWSVRRAFTAQIIINHVQAREDEHIDNMEQAMERAVANGVKHMIIQPTHLMHGAEYDELMEVVNAYQGKIETIAVAEPLLGQVGSDATVINEDKAAVAEAVVAAAVADAGMESIEKAAEEKIAFVLMGHGTSHTAKVSYSQMQTQMNELGYKNVFIGTVEGEPEETACENVIEAVAAAGYSKVILRPLMVVAGDHANNDMAGDDEDSWKSMFVASEKFESVDCQIAGLGRIEAVKALYVAHTAALVPMPIEEVAEPVVEETTAEEEVAAAAIEETTEAATEEVTEAAVEETTEAATEEVTEAAVEETTEAATEEATEAPFEETTEAAAEETANPDQEAADAVAALIDAIYVQTRNENTDEQCAAAKAAWDALTDEQKELVEGEEADPDYFGRDTGDASLDDPRNADEIGEKEILVVSFGTSFNDSRAQDIKGVEDAIQAAFPEWSVRRAFTAQIIINHVQAREDEHIDNMDQAMERAVANGVKHLIIQPTHLMHGAEYDELMEVVNAYQGMIETIAVAEPLLGQVGSDATVINEDKAAVAEAVVAAAVADAGMESIEKAAEEKIAFVLMGHGTSHTAKVSYSQMQTQMNELGYKNVFIGTVEGEPEETACENVINTVAEAGYTKVILRPLMVVAGDHANNDMAGDDEDSWKSMFVASEKFESVDCQIAGLGRIEAVKALYVAHTAALVPMPIEEVAEPVVEETTAEEEVAAAAVEETTEAETEEATEAPVEETTEAAEETANPDQEAADAVAALIDAIYVQTRNVNTDEQCAAAKAAWDALTDEQKELVEGEEADPDYFGRDTGDASLDDPRNADEIGEKEILVVSFGTSFNDSRAQDIKGVEDAVQAAFPEWSVRRAFTAQIIINHVQAREDEHIDNMDQAMERAVANGVKHMIIQPTHLMHGAEYDELMEVVNAYQGKIETIAVAEPLLGQVGSDATVINEDKAAVAEAVVAAAVADAGMESIEKAAEEKIAFVLMGHGTSHTAKVSYSQMQTQMNELGYKNVFIGTVEGEPEETACENVIEAVAAAGYTKVILRPLMVVAGDHANNDMAGDEEDSWKSMFVASEKFESVDCQIAGLGRIETVQALYVAHTAAVMDAAPEAEAEVVAAAETGALADGVYSVKVDTDSSMFHVNEACEGKGTLTVENGKMTLHMTLAAKGITKLFLGSAEDAAKEGAAVLDYTEDTVNFSDGTTDTAYGFDVPVEELDVDIAVATFGKKSETWKDHTIHISEPEAM